MSSNASKHLTSLEKLDGTNWEDWAYSVRSTFRLTHILRIAEGKEARPKPASLTAPTEAEKRAIDDWDRRNDEGLGLIQLTVKPAVRQTIKENETLAENWKRLEATYGTRTGLNLWVDITKYITTSFSPELPLMQQIDEMSELRSRIETAEMPIADSLHAMLLLHALPSTYEIVQQTILASVSDYKTITSANMRSRILSEELRQGTTAAISAIRTGKKASNTCNFCGAPGHWERECRRKKRGLSKEEAQSERKKWGANNMKEKETAKEPPSVSATIQEVPNTPSSSTTDVSVASASIESLIFYIAREAKWMLDSGCSDHITHDISDFSKYQRLPIPQYIRLADGNTRVSYVGIGTVIATMRIRGVPKQIILKDVIHSPDLGGRFISIRKIGNRGISTTFTGDTVTLSSNGVDYAEGHLLGQQYWLTLQASAPSINAIQHNIPIETLHARLGHLSWSALRKLSGQIDPNSKRTLSTCEGCLLGKSTRRSFKNSHSRQTKPFALVHMDLAGPMRTKSIQGSFYYYIIVDDNTRFKWVFFLRTKDQAFEKFKIFYAFVHTQFNTTLKLIRSDRGGEFLSTEFIKFMDNKGIEHQLTAPYTPQQNGVAERANRTIVGAARALLQSAGMSNMFWESAISTAVHVRNRAPSRVNNYVSPHEKLFGQAPDISYLRTFGCLAYRHVTETRTKFDPTSECLVFTGYKGSTKSYKLWNPKAQKFIISTDVTFEETIFPLHT